MSVHVPLADFDPGAPSAAHTCTSVMYLSGYQEGHCCLVTGILSCISVVRAHTHIYETPLYTHTYI